MKGNPLHAPLQITPHPEPRFALLRQSVRYPEQVELLAWVYEFRYSINAAADIMNMSRRKATYILQDLREKYYLQQYQDQKPRKFIENPV